MEDRNNPSTIVDVIIIFLKNKIAIFIGTFVFCLIAIILYFFVFDLIFLSTSTVKSAGRSSSLLGSLGESVTGLGGLDDFSLGSSKSAKEMALYEQILKSRKCLEDVIRKFGIMESEKIQYMDDAVKYFIDEKLLIKQDNVSGILTVGIYDKDPQRAKEILEYVLSSLDKINIEIGIENAKNNRVFVERRYLQAKEDLAASEDSLKKYQTIYGIAPDLQIKASAQIVFTMEAELKTEEVKLDVLRNMLSEDQLEVKSQIAKVNSIKNKIVDIRSSTDLDELLKLGNSPQVLMGYLRHQRDVEINTKILSFVLPLYEQAKIEEKKETPTIIVLDSPNVADKKTKPKRFTMVLLITAIGFVFTLSFFVLKEKAYTKVIILKSQLK
ncbi:MAG: hypothetical protein IAE90_01090 [Ignavibacteria bacterium]|nr:hypothetical protein [Ignavibacteria bacterium]